MKKNALTPNGLTGGKRKAAKAIITSYVYKYLSELSEREKEAAINDAMNAYLFDIMDAEPVAEAFRMAGIV